MNFDELYAISTIYIQFTTEIKKKWFLFNNLENSYERGKKYLDIQSICTWVNSEHYQLLFIMQTLKHFYIRISHQNLFSLLKDKISIISWCDLLLSKNRHEWLIVNKYLYTII